MKKERKLTEAEQKRKESFERLSEEMVKQGYSRKDIKQFDQQKIEIMNIL